ncbi:MAG: phosphotransferase [Verrucomicrobiae bacterium]|nr:phosphotransferase [Verrucomicrobiae bacterium]
MIVARAASASLPDAAWRAEAERRLAAHGLSRDAAIWEPLAEGGSDRAFWRVRAPAGGAWVVMRYSPAVRKENALYAGIAGFLREAGLRVPALLFHEAASGLLGLEDLGEISLHRRFWEKGSDGPALDALYQDALDQAALLHARASAPTPTMPGFDAELYRWERRYFLENLVEKRIGLLLIGTRRKAIEAEGEALAEELCRLPRRLIHRDFQSQNLMVRGRKTWLIDFQGMRLGHPAYDLASLLEDPYTDLGPTRRRMLLARHLARHDADAALAEGYLPAAVQRLMQALGAYGYLGAVLGKTAFLAHIPRALARLDDALDGLPHMNSTRELVHELRGHSSS